MHDEIGAADRLAGIVGDLGDRHDVLAERAAEISMLPRSRIGAMVDVAAAVKPHGEATQRQIGRRGASAVAGADDRNLADRPVIAAAYGRATS